MLLSLVCCTYKPTAQLMERILAAMAAQQAPPGHGYEVIIVDNNSPAPVSAQPYTRVLPASEQVRYIVEQRQGLSFAREAGILAARGSWVIFVDDDNELAPGYVQNAIELVEAYPNVGAWGPGNIEVEFIGTPEDYAAAKPTSFQAQTRTDLEFACLQGGWQDCYPAGTGQLVRRDILLRYLNLRTQGKLSATDRKGDSLASAGDVQIVFEAIKMGLAAGKAPSLRLRHLIEERKATFAYLRRHAYGTATSYAQAYRESFGQLPPHHHLPGNTELLGQVATITTQALRNRQGKDLVLALGRYLGGIAGNYAAVGKPTPGMVNRIASWLKVQ